MGSFKIAKGNHFSYHLPKLRYGKKNLNVIFKFTDTCWFKLETPDDFAINKLVGWSTGLHHTNSIRCGWTPAKDTGKIDLFFYVYQDGVRYEQFFVSVDIGTEYELEMNINNNLLSFTLRNDNITSVNSIYYKTPCDNFGYILFPYIGGRKPARIDTYIDLEFC